MDATEQLARRVWALKYRAPGERRWEDTARRVADALAKAERTDREQWADRFFELLRDRSFLPGGRILATAGTERRSTLLSCFVMGVVEDSLEGIFSALKDTAATLQQGGGVGLDFSTLRPRGTRARASAVEASGPVSFMRLWDTASEVLFTHGPRRGAMMATLRIDHPDVHEFLSAKAAGGVLRNFNLSVQVPDTFLQAVARDESWPLVFPASALDGDGGGEYLERPWTGSTEPVRCRVLDRLPARQLWRDLLEAAWESGEPGVLFVDTLNRLNNLRWREQLTATNPCGEEPLPPHGACNLGSLNLVRFVRQPFEADAELDLVELSRAASLAVRMLDDVLEVSGYPLEGQRAQAHGSRRLGLGITGLGDALVMLGLSYDSPDARELATRAMRAIRDTAYEASISLARERGPFPWFERDRFLEAPFVRALPSELREAIARDGIRNSHLLAIAPAGSISLLAGNVSSGIEPIFAHEHRRILLGPEGREEFEVSSASTREWRRLYPNSPFEPPHFADAQHLAPEAHLEMQAALQPFVDGAISKTVNAPRTASFEEFASLFDRAHALGLKGCTVFRLETVTGAILEPIGDHQLECCRVEPAT